MGARVYNYIGARVYIDARVNILARTSIISHARQYIIMTGRANMCSCARGEREKKLLATEATEEIVLGRRM